MALRLQAFRSNSENKGENTMKKLATLILMLASFGFLGMSEQVNAATANALGKPQVRIEIGQRRRRWRNRDWARGDRIGYRRTYTRNVYRGRHLFRETYQVRYLPNGRTQSFLISRVRLY